MRNSFSTSGSRVVETASRVIGDKSPRLDTQRILRHDFPCDATQTTSSIATQADVAFQRQFRLTEQLNLRFRPEFFKLFGQSTQTLASYLGTGGQMPRRKKCRHRERRPQPPLPNRRPPLHPARPQAPILSNESGRLGPHSSLPGLWDFHCERQTSVFRPSKLSLLIIL